MKINTCNIPDATQRASIEAGKVKKRKLLTISHKYKIDL